MPFWKTNYLYLLQGCFTVFLLVLNVSGKTKHTCKWTQTHTYTFFYWKVKTGYPIILRRISIITKVYYFLCLLLICVFCFANCLLHMCDCQTVSLAFVFFMRSRIILTTVCWVPRRGPRHLKQNMFKN